MTGNKTIKITVERSIVTEVKGLPPGFDYEINDLDVSNRGRSCRKDLRDDGEILTFENFMCLKF